jgi:diguanylate cyclase (GGDEF)-like protein
MEIDYTTMAQQVDNIQLYENGYAFLNDDQGDIIYHPHIDPTTFTDETKPKTPEGLLSDQTFIHYTYDGIDKLAVWKPLSNGMRLNVTVPTKEINRSWQRLITEILLVSAVLVILFTLAALHLSGHITRPLQKLTKVAEQINVGNYNYELDVTGTDEVAILSATFNKVGEHLRRHFEELNSLVYVDALTSVRNKAAYDLYVKDLQKALLNSQGAIEFAVVLFDCDGLKKINDRYGHDKGDLYLQNACHQICIIFEHSPVFRTGGDEFVSFLLKQDFNNRQKLMQSFRQACSKSREQAKAPWEQVKVSLGLAVYDPNNDGSVRDVVRRADKLMYQDKWKHKKEIKSP